MTPLILALCFIAVGFLIGAIPTAFLFVQKLQGLDIREFGSGNVGATNATRVLGRRMGYVVFAVDFLKGAAPILIHLQVLTWFGFSESFFPWIGLAPIFGHIFTPFLGFRGGKGVATGAGVVAALYPVVFFPTILLWIGSFFLWRIVSVSSLIAILSLFLFGFLMKTGPHTLLFFLTLLLVALWTHRENLQRLSHGTEKNKVNR